MQQLPTLLGQQCWKLLRPSGVQTDASWDMQCIVGRINFDRFETLRNNMQQGVQTDVTYNIQQCCVNSCSFVTKVVIRIS